MVYIDVSVSEGFKCDQKIFSLYYKSKDQTAILVAS